MRGLAAAGRAGARHAPADAVHDGQGVASLQGAVGPQVCDRLEVDLRWQAAAGLHTGAESFHPTMLPGQRNRLGAPPAPGAVQSAYSAERRERSLIGAGSTTSVV